MGHLNVVRQTSSLVTPADERTTLDYIASDCPLSTFPQELADLRGTCEADFNTFAP